MSDATPKKALPIAIVHPDNPEKKVEGHQVVEHESGPLEGYFVGVYDEQADEYTW